MELWHRIKECTITVLKLAVLFFITFVLQNLNNVNYKFPQEGHFFYGNFFIFGPVVLFFYLSFLSSLLFSLGMLPFKISFEEAATDLA